MSKILAIDLGTGFSAMSIWDGNTYKIIENAEGKRTTPSVVAINADGTTLVGQTAKNQMVTNPESTIYEVKRLIGKSFKDKKVQEDIKKFPYKCKEGKNGGVVIEVHGKDYTPEQISAMILSKLKTDAEAYLGEKIEKAIITVPAYFNNEEREATKIAGKIAGMEVVRIINEPTSAALAYGFDKKENGYIAVYDNGSGTLDISILELSDGVFEVKSTNGDVHCGGSDVDKILIDYIAEEFKKTNGIDLRDDILSLQRMKEVAENAKINLSSSLETDINAPYITATASGPLHLNMKLTRAKFEELISDWVKRTLKPFDQALKDAGLKKSDIKELIMVGGSTRIPLIQKSVQEYFNGKELNKSINPDECVSAGASVEAGILQGDNKSDILLLDVTPLTLSIETMGGIATKMIERNTTIPTHKDQIFSTAEDGQTAVTIRICQGERTMFADNKLLGQFNLEGIAPAPRGVPQIEVSFDIDANGIIKVSAIDKGTGKEQSISITGSTKLDDAEVDRMVAEAEANKQADEHKKKIIEAKNLLESAINNARKSIKDNEEVLKEHEDITNSVNSEIESAEKVLKESDSEQELQESFEKLNNALMEIGKIVYQNKQSDSTNPEEPVTPEAV